MHQRTTDLSHRFYYRGGIAEIRTSERRALLPKI